MCSLRPLSSLPLSRNDTCANFFTALLVVHARVVSDRKEGGREGRKEWRIVISSETIARAGWLAGAGVLAAGWLARLVSRTLDWVCGAAYFCCHRCC